MKTGIKIAGGVVVAAIIAVVVIVLVNNGNNPSKTADQTNEPTAKTTQKTQPKSQPKQEAKAVTIDQAVAKISMQCQSSGATQSGCTWNGKKYTLAKPSDWSADQSKRKQACDQGYVNSNYQILTDSKSYYFTTDYNQDLQALSTALNKTGVTAHLAAYCE
ncbi:MAG: hypothetical protein ACREGA_00765 [Candidatus Saccharimonadales bacterium]